MLPGNNFTENLNADFFETYKMIFTAVSVVFMGSLKF